MGRLDGKVAIITGGARGMGASHARRFVAEGAKVVVTDVLETEGLALEKEIGGHIKFVRQDVTNASDWSKVVSAAELYGAVNVLVNNAGIACMTGISDTGEEEYRKVMDVNALSVFLGMKAVLPSMRSAGGGSIINISSIYGVVGAPVAAYVASKFAVTGLTKAAAIEFGPYHIRVNSVHPGVIITPMSRAGLDRAQAMLKMMPLARAAEPEESSNMVLYLASDESSYSTGAEFMIDGGMSAM